MSVPAAHRWICLLYTSLAGYVVAIIMTLTMSHTGVTADGVKYTYSWVVNFDEVKNAAWIAVPVSYTHLMSSPG